MGNECCKARWNPCPGLDVGSNIAGTGHRFQVSSHSTINNIGRNSISCVYSTCRCQAKESELQDTNLTGVCIDLT